MQSVDPQPGPEGGRHVPGPQFPFRSRGASRRDRATRGFDRFRPRFTIGVVFFALPILMIPSAIFLAPTVSGAWAASHGYGVHGTFTSYDQSCDGAGITSIPWPNSCTLTGLFDPSDGSLPVDATLDASTHTTQVNALDVVAPGEHPTDGTSVYVAGSRGWVEPVIFELVALGMLGVWVVLMRRAWLERRRHRRQLTLPGYADDGGRHRA